MNLFLYTYDPSPSSYYKEGRKEYEKRLSRYCKIRHTLCKNEKQLDKAVNTLSLQTDSQKNLFVFVESGHTKSEIDSVALSEFLNQSAVSGISGIFFLIGFPEEFRSSCSGNTMTLSLSRMDMNLSLQSLIMEEQIYRAYRILNKEPYHK